MRPAGRDFSKPRAPLPKIWDPYVPTAVAAPITTNSQRLDGLVHNVKFI